MLDYGRNIVPQYSSSVIGCASTLEPKYHLARAAMNDKALATTRSGRPCCLWCRDLLLLRIEPIRPSSREEDMNVWRTTSFVASRH